MNDPGFLRAFRAFLAAIGLGNGLFGVLNALAGHAYALVSFALAAACAWLVAAQTRRIGHMERGRGPGPDYGAIAEMEREVYGETFAHSGAPALSAREALDRQMDDLASLAERRGAGSGRYRCGALHGYSQAHRRTCAECNRREGRSS